MSERWSKAALVAFGLAALFVLVSVPFRSHELTFEGKSLQHWIERLRETDSADAQMAISQIGPKAVPFLLQQVRRETRPLQHSHYFDFGAKGPSEKPMAGEPGSGRDERLNYRIMGTIRLMGAAALPPLLTALDDSDSAVRLQAVRAIGAISPEADLVFPVLTKLLGDPDWEIQDIAVTLLGRMRHRRNLVAPALLEKLTADPTRWNAPGMHQVRTHLVAELGRMGQEARAAVPELRTMLNGADRELRREAALALCRIAGDTNALTLLLVELKQTRDGRDRLPILLGIHQMGRSAKAAALPLLELAADTSGSDLGRDKEIQSAARQVLLHIDPEIAAQLPPLK
jgi:HEAT repeat protein